MICRPHNNAKRAWALEAFFSASGSLLVSIFSISRRALFPEAEKRQTHRSQRETNLEKHHILDWFQLIATSNDEANALKYLMTSWPSKTHDNDLNSHLPRVCEACGQSQGKKNMTLPWAYGLRPFKTIFQIASYTAASITLAYPWLQWTWTNKLIKKSNQFTQLSLSGSTNNKFN